MINNIHRKTALAFCVLMLFYNCTNNTYIHNESCYNPDALYNNAIEINGERLQNELFSMPFFKGFFTSYGFWGSMKADNNKIVHILNCQTAELITSEGTIGRGPNELLIPHAIDYVPKIGTLFLEDITRSLVVPFYYQNNKITPGKSINLTQRDKGCVIYNMQAISDSLFVIRVNDIAPPYSCYLAIVNSRNETLDSLQIYQLDNDNIEHSKIRNIDATIRLSPNRKNLIVCNAKYNHLTNYSLDGNKFKQINKKFILEPKLSIKNGKIKRDPLHLQWESEVFTSANYIYVVSNPETRGDYLKRLKDFEEKGERFGELTNNSYILVFDYDFNFIKSYKCDDHFHWITIAPDEKTIYASTYLDGCYLTKYVLEGLK